MLVITYDEHGGFFDHVPPPMTTDDTLAKFGVDGFQQMGFRVPAMVDRPVREAGLRQLGRSTTTRPRSSTCRTRSGSSRSTSRMDAANDLTDCIDMDRLAKGELGQADRAAGVLDVADWPQPMDPCSHTRRVPPRRSDQPWADAHPSAFAGLDLRGELPGYNASIRNYLRAHGLLRG